MSRKIRLVSIVMVLATVACSVALPSIGGRTGSGNVIALEQDVSDFDSLEVSTAFKVTITQGDVSSVVIHIDDNLQPYLRVEQVGRKVSIGLDTDIGLNFGNTTLQAEITMPSLASLDLSGATQATLVDFIVDGSVTLDASGASKIEGMLQAGAVDLTLSGASSSSLTGSAEALRVDASGASSADLGVFPAADVVVVVSGASSATVNASGTLEADASGASHVTYLGSPTLRNVSTAGASSVEPE
jgi:hypothetical protein